MGVNPFNSYSPTSSTGSTSLPPASGKTVSVLWRWSTLHLGPPTSVLCHDESSSCSKFFPCVYTHIPHSSRTSLRKNASGSCFLFCHRGWFNGCWRSQWSVSRQGAEQGLNTQRNENSCFQQSALASESQLVQNAGEIWVGHVLQEDSEVISRLQFYLHRLAAAAHASVSLGSL